MDTGHTLAFGTRLRRARRAAGLTQEAVAARAGVSVRTISDIERGVNHAPHADTVALLAGALGLQAGELRDFVAAANRLRRQPDPVAATVRDDTACSPLVGRRAELGLLERHLLGEGPPVLLLAGEPGIGKSRLLAEVPALATADGWTVLQGGCRRRGGQEPYAPLLEALQRHLLGQPTHLLRTQLEGCAWLVRLLPELAAGPIEPLPPWTVSPEQERRLMDEAVLRLLHNSAGPTGTLLLLDDVQWAGPDALDLLALLLRRATSIPLRLIGAYRDTELQPGEPLALLLADLAHGGLVTHRRLNPLAPVEAAALLQAVLPAAAADLRARVQARAGGVPFFLVSCAQGLRHPDQDGRQEGLPWAVAQSIRQRVGALPAGAGEVLAVAAIIGREVPRALLGAVAPQERDQVLAACEAACGARLLAEDGVQGYRFAHDVVREVLEADLGAGRRALVHGRIATALEQAPGAPPVEVLAYHYERAGMLERAVQYLELAGDQARVRGAHAAAEQHYRAVAVRLDRLGRGLESARVREKLAGVLATTARYDAALAILAEAAAASDAASDVEGLGRIAASEGHLHYARGTPEEGVACLRPIVASLEARGPSVALGLVYCSLAELNLHWGQWAEEVAAAEQAVHMARLVGDDRVLVRAALLRGAALCLMGNDQEGLPVLQEVINLAETVGDRESLYLALDLVAWVSRERGEFQQSSRYYERAVPVLETLGNPVLLASACVEQGLLACATGEWECARACYEQAAAIHREISLAPLSCDAGGLLIALGQLSLQQGAWEESARALEQARIIFAPQGKLAGLRESQGALAELDILAGRPAAARARLLPLLDRRSVEEHHVTTDVLPMLAWAHLELGDLEQASRVVEAAIRRARARAYRFRLVAALRIQALVALRQAQWAVAEACLEEGLALARALPYPYGEGRLLVVAAQLHLRRGEQAVAHARLDAALALFIRLGAHKEREQAVRLMATYA